MEPKSHLVVVSADVMPVVLHDDEAGTETLLKNYCTITLGRTLPDNSVEVVDVLTSVPEVMVVAIQALLARLRG